MRPTAQDYQELDQRLAGVGTAELTRRVAGEHPIEPPGPEKKLPEIWEPPIPFNGTPVEAFPVEVLPLPLQGIVSEIGKTVQVPIDLPAMVALSVCAVPLARKLEITVRGDHVEPLNLYTLTILESGNRKSATFRELVQPLCEWEQAERERLSPEIEEEGQEYRIQEARLKTLEARAAKEDVQNEREVLIQEAKELKREMSEPRALPRILADDVTQERLSTLMLENNQRMAILSAEGDFFDSLGRYDKNGMANIGLLIKSHCGDFWAGDRMGREGSLDSPALTLGLLGQREILRGFMERPSFRGRGLLARFLYSIPISSVGGRGYRENSISEMTKRAYASMMERLFSLPWGGTPEKREPHILTLSEDAFREWKAFYDQIEKDLAPGGPLDWLADWGSKLPGQVARIAGIFHCVSVGTSSPWEVPVSAVTMLSAVTVGHYLRSHAVAAFREMGADKSEGEAQAVFAWIERKGIEQFKAGDVLGSLSRFHNMNELAPILALLQERNYIREVTQERKGKTGRQPAPLYEVNPHILDTTSKTSNTSKRDT